MAFFCWVKSSLLSMYISFLWEICRCAFLFELSTAPSKMLGADGTERMSEVLNVVFPSSASPRTQTLYLSLVSPCLGCLRVGSVLYISFPSCAWGSGGPLQLQAQISGFNGRLTGWFQLLRKALGDGHSFVNLASSIDCR